MDRRQVYDDQDRWLEKQTYNLNYEMWEKLYKPDILQFESGQITFGGQPVETAVTEVSAVDEYWESLQNPRKMTGAMAATLDDPDEEGWE